MQGYLDATGRAVAANKRKISINCLRINAFVDVIVAWLNFQRGNCLRRQGVGQCQTQ